jgi:hypothetical protein
MDNTTFVEKFDARKQRFEPSFRNAFIDFNWN